jgi:hypothetical protein
MGVKLTACVQTIGYIEGIEDKDMTNFEHLIFTVSEKKNQTFLSILVQPARVHLIVPKQKIVPSWIFQTQASCCLTPL